MKLKTSPASTDLLGGSEHSPQPSDEKLKQQQQQFEPQWWERVAMFVGCSGPLTSLPPPDKRKQIETGSQNQVRGKDCDWL